jgi:hypothetical protein
VSLYRISLLLCGAVLVFFPVSVQGESLSVLIKEVQIAGEVSDDEFIELYNPNNIPVDISNWQLRRKTESGSVSSIKVFAKDTLVAPYSYYLWANSKGIFSSIADATTSSSALASNNSIALYTKSGTDGILIDSISWGKGGLFQETDTAQITPLKNESLLRGTSGSWIITKPSNPKNSHSDPSSPTPIVIPTPKPEPSLPPTPPSPEATPVPPVISPTPTPLPEPPLVVPLNTTISISEILPNPLPPDEEFIELYNQSDEPVDISGWTLHDASKTGKYTFKAKTTIKPHEYLVTPKSVFKFALNNSNETLTLLDAIDNNIHTLTYKKSIAGVSQNVLGDTTLRGGVPTPGKANQVNDLPKTRVRVPKVGFVDFKITFDARGKDSETKKLKYVWEFGDGHKSYQEQPTHTYTEKGAYKVTLTTKDEQDEVTETFILKIKKYIPPKVRITGFIPNPEGKDSEGEWLELENKSDDSISLENWSVATGTKNKTITNHPIRTKIILEAHSTLRLTREDSLFSLPNKKGYIELRAPNKQVVDDVRYKEESSITEDAVYQKEDGGWKPVSSLVLGEATVAALDIEEASIEESTEQEILPIIPTRTEEQKEIVYQNLKQLVEAPSFHETLVLSMEHTPSSDSLSPPKKKDSFESFQEKLNASLVSFLW